MMHRVFFASLTALFAAASLTSAYAQEGFDSGIAGSRIVPDGELAAIRGRYLPATSGVRAIEGSSRPDALNNVPASGVARAAAGVTPGVSGAIAGSVVSGVTVSLASAWERPDQNGVLGGYSAGASLSLDASGNVRVSTATWSSTIGTGLGPVPTTGTVTGAPFAGLTGIGQGIEVAGNGNTVVNVLHVDDGASRNIDVPRGVGPCGGNCTFTVGSGFGLAIDGPGGAVQQAIGPHGLFQTVQLTSDFNSVINAMNVQVTSGASAALIPKLTVVPPPSKF
jgi:hypothetical protein